MLKIPQISTRGYYDLDSGKLLKNNPYSLSPKKFFTNLDDVSELTIMIHGLRNNRQDAKNKFSLAKNRLKKIGYRYPLVGFTYDSNTKGAHLKKYVKKSLRVGQIIAKKNGTNLGKFILDIKKNYPKIKIRLIGHSLGTEVIFHTINYLAKKSCSKNIIYSAYFFGSSVSGKDISEKNFRNSLRYVLEKKLVNYVAPNDEVLSEGVAYDLLVEPLGLFGLSSKFPKFEQKKVIPQNHRFASYAKVLKKYP